MPLRYAPGAPGTYDQPLTIGHLLDANVLSAADQEIVYRDRIRMTYRDLRRRVGSLASALKDLGVGQGTTVAMLDWDSHRYLEAFLAVPMMGAVMQTANFRLSLEHLRYTLEHAGAEVVLAHSDFLPLVEAMRPSLPTMRAVVAIVDDADERPPAWCVGEYEDLLAAAPADFPFADFDETALATTFYTSGTTGLPKGVCFSHRQLVLHTLAVAAAFGTAEGPRLGRADVYMPLTPMFHVHAWGLPYVATLLGLKQVYPGRYDPDRILDLRRREGVTFSHCVPTVLQMVLSAVERSGERLDKWHFVIGGSALTRELRDAVAARGADVTSGYGMSETGPVIALGRHGTDPRGPIRSGTPVPLVSARVVNDDMDEMPSDDTTQGELILRAPWLTHCYVGDEPASDALWRGGWLHTQDVATLAPDGAIQIRDRIKDVIKTGGEWICSLTLEDLVAGRPDVAEVAVIGVADPKWQERPVAIVVPRGPIAPTVEAVRSTLGEAVSAGRISRYALIDRIELVDALPRTSVGKIDKKRLREMFAVSDQS